MPESLPTQAAQKTRVGRIHWMNVALWVAQVLLALQFLLAGGLKLLATEEFIARAAWAADVPRGLLLFIGAAEVLGALGVVLPRLTRIQPRLTILAALGLLSVMALAAAFHMMRGEWNLGMVAFLGLLAAFVAYGRWKLSP